MAIPLIFCEIYAKKKTRPKLALPLSLIPKTGPLKLFIPIHS